MKGVAMAPGKGRPMSDEHKAAMAEGRAQGRAVRAYLEALETHKPKRGRKRTPATMRARIETIDGSIDAVDPMKRLQMIQERMDLEKAIEASETTIDLTALESAFAEAAKGYGERNGISYAAWRKVGVPAAVLKKAGVGRGG
jgi:hypothetical protein